MRESFLEKEEALGVLMELARESYEGTFPEGEKTETAARAVLDEMIAWCGMRKVPRGALYEAAEELKRRLERRARGEVKSIRAGNLSIEYGESDTLSWHMKLRPWRRVRF